MIKNKNILIISTVGIGYDGISNVIISLLEAMNLRGMNIYIAGTINVDCDKRLFLEGLGCRVVDFPNRKKSPLKYFLALIKFIKQNNIEVVHAHGNSATLSIELLAAKIGGAKKRIAHSHNTTCTQIKADKILRPLFNNLYSIALACGKEAGKWLFTRGDFMVINNGRNIKRFQFNEAKRLVARQKLNIDGIAIGHVGGFVPQKNHDYVVKIYHEIIKSHPDIKLYFVGDGYLKKEIENQVKALGIEKNIIFTGNVDNIEEYLLAFDAMVFPSFFEGLPLVVLEWQISGLPCIISDTVTKDCIFSDFVKTMDINTDAKIWAKTILMMVNTNREQNSLKAIKNIIENEYDINTCAEKIRNIYLT